MEGAVGHGDEGGLVGYLRERGAGGRKTHTFCLEGFQHKDKTEWEYHILGRKNIVEERC